MEASIESTHASKYYIPPLANLIETTESNKNPGKIEAPKFSKPPLRQGELFIAVRHPGEVCGRPFIWEGEHHPWAVGGGGLLRVKAAAKWSKIYSWEGVCIVGFEPF